LPCQYLKDEKAIWLEDQIYAVVKEEKLTNEVMQLGERETNFIKLKKK